MIGLDDVRFQCFLVACFIDFLNEANRQELQLMEKLVGGYNDRLGGLPEENTLLKVAREVLAEIDRDAGPDSDPPASAEREADNHHSRDETPIVPGGVKLPEKELLKLVRTREVFNALHFSGWMFDPEQHPSKLAVLDMIPHQDAELDYLCAGGEVLAIQESAPHVTVVVRRDCTSADAARLLQKLATAIQTYGLDNLDGSITQNPALERWRGSRAAQLDGAA